MVASLTKARYVVSLEQTPLAVVEKRSLQTQTVSHSPVATTNTHSRALGCGFITRVTLDRRVLCVCEGKTSVG
jgi:hypothetical protein